MTLFLAKQFRFRRKLILFTFVLTVFLNCLNQSVFAQTPIKLGVLVFGTVNWEIATLQNENLLNDVPFKLDIIPLANPQTGKIALQSKSVDMIVSDWIWVSRMRASGTDFTFYPYSNTSGAIVVTADSPIKNLADLSGKRLGIAGGELDKNWLLLQTLAHRQNIDLSTTQKIFAAPPLLNEQLKAQRLDAVINYWHYAARLQAEGYRQLIDGEQILKQLGVNERVPSLGYVFRSSWAEQNRPALIRFLEKTKEAKDRLCTSQKAWDSIAALTKSNDPIVQTTLRQRYCDGRIQHWGDEQIAAAAVMYQYVRQLSGNELTGTSEHIQPGTFWQ